MEAIDYIKLMPKEVQARIVIPEDPIRASLENRVRGFNARRGEDDGTGIDCPLCKNRGNLAVYLEEEGRMVVRACQCRSRRQTARRLKRCGILERARHLTLENFHTDTPLRARMKRMTEDWLADPGSPWLGFFGQSGAGKTHLCTAAFVQAVARRQVEGSYMLWGPALREIKAGLLDRQWGLLEEYKNAPLLYIDDLFKGRTDQPLSDADLRLAFELLDHRYNLRLPTIVSSERSFPQLSQMDEAIAGRIRERCGPYIISITPGPGKNYRCTEEAYLA